MKKVLSLLMVILLITGTAYAGDAVKEHHADNKILETEGEHIEEGTEDVTLQEGDWDEEPGDMQEGDEGWVFDDNDIEDEPELDFDENMEEDPEHELDENIEEFERMQYRMNLADEVTVTTFQELKEAVEGIVGDGSDRPMNPITVVIGQDIEISEGITITDGQDITLIDDGLAVRTLKREDPTSSEPLLTIEEGGKLTIDETLEDFFVIDSNGGGEKIGRDYNYPGVMIQCYGTLDLNGGNISGWNADNNSYIAAAISIYGKNAELNISGGKITNHKLVSNTAALYAGNEAKVYFEDGAISDNKLGNLGTNACSVVIANGSLFHMTGGQIYNNDLYHYENGSGYSSTSSGGVLVLSDSSSSVETRFIMDGGSIHHNLGGGAGAIRLSSREGALSKVGLLYFEMNGGVIENNKANTNFNPNMPRYSSGGVLVNSPSVDAVIKNGTFIENEGTHGGAIMLYECNSFHIEKALFQHNKAVFGGAIFIEGDDEDQLTLSLDNALIYENQAVELNGTTEYGPSGVGGGIWQCQYGRVHAFDESLTLFNNSAMTAGDDIANLEKEYSLNTKSTIPNIMLGNSIAAWYYDWSDSRYDENEIGNVYGRIIDMQEALYAKNIVDLIALEKAAEKATVIIENNTANYGGGIAVNGELIVGEELYLEYVIYDANGGMGGRHADPMKDVPYSVLDGSDVKFYKEGHRFIGWSDVDGGTVVNPNYKPGTELALNAGITLYAVWQPALQVFYDGNPPAGAAVSGETIDNNLYLPDEQAKVLDNNYTLENYRFMSWNTEANGDGTSYHADDTIVIEDTDITLFAQWEAEYHVLYDANEPSGKQSTGKTLDTADYLTGEEALIKENEFLIDGCGFIGWNTKADGSGETYQPGDTFLMPGADVTLYAMWKTTAYTVTYNQNAEDASGSTVDGNNPYPIGDTVTVLANGYHRDGYEFTEWNTKADGSGETYQPGDTFLMPEADVTLYAMWKATAPGKTGGGSSGSSSNLRVTYYWNDGTDNVYLRYSVLRSSRITAPTPPVREGYTFEGWFLDKACTDAYDFNSLVNRNLDLYAKWLAEEEIEEEEKKITKGILNLDDHFAYIVGYPDGTVRPGAQITRGEVATIFFRLLNEDVRNTNLVKTNTFYDVAQGDWYNNAVSTLAGLGIVAGYQDGSFQPNAPITRAEVAAMAVRFEQEFPQYRGSFSDISGHWAKDAILQGAALGWVSGYEDGSFRPDAPITRAEMMTMVNRVLNRQVNSTAQLADGYIRWPDNPETSWYYYEVIEATNTHDYEVLDEKEQWTVIQPNRDWSKLERG